LANGLAQLAQFARVRADDMARHDGGGGLAQRAGFYVVGEIGDDGAVHLEIDLHGRAAQFRMRGGTGVRVGEAAEARNIAGEFDDPLVVNVVQHRAKSSIPPRGAPLAAPVHSPIYVPERRKYSPAVPRPMRDLQGKSPVAVLGLPGNTRDSGVRRARSAPSAR